MAIETRERRIGSTHYRVTQLPAKAGRAMLVRYIKLIGPSAGALISGAGRSGAAGATSFDMALGVGVGDGIAEFCDRLTESELATISDQFAQYTVVVESRDVERRLSDVFDDHFAGKYDEMLQWFRFCSEVNFASFFAVAAKGREQVMRQVVRAAVSAWPSPAASTGTSGESPVPSASPTA